MTEATEEGVVWIVDDSPLEAEAARRALSGTFHNFVFADGSAMLEYLAAHDPPDVVVLDGKMPGISGLEVCAFLRSEARTVATPILLLTAHDSVVDVVDGLEAGANDYVQKPVAPDELLARVRALRRANELRLRAERAERALRTLLEQLPDPLLACDAQGRVAFVNAPAMEALSHASASLVGVPISQVIPGLDLQTIGSRKQDITIGDRIYEAAARDVFLDSGTRRAITLRDVTEKRRNDDRRLDFYSIISHDLRSPMSALLLRIEILKRGGRGALPPAAQAEIETMGQRIHELVGHITDFLDLARMDRSALTLQRTRFDLRALVERQIEDVRPLADGKRIKFELQSPATVELTGDRRRITQVVMNLLSNAVKFSPEGGRVEVRLSANDRMVEAEISDEGPGIPDEVIPRLFKRFSRNETRPTAAGTGLGLMIVRELIEAHGGEVGVKSKVGKGTTFWFRMPAAEAAAAV